MTGVQTCALPIYGDMVIMSMEVYQSIMQKVEVYKDVEVSELQIEAGQVREARAALADMREKYGI